MLNTEYDLLKRLFKFKLIYFYKYKGKINQYLLVIKNYIRIKMIKNYQFYFIKELCY